MFFPLVGKLYRQYGYRPEAVRSMVDTACGRAGESESFHHLYRHQHSALHVWSHSRGTTQENGDTARNRLQRGPSRVPGMFDGKGAAEVHRVVDARQSS